jgi:hypothetical protein
VGDQGTLFLCDSISNTLNHITLPVTSNLTAIDASSDTRRQCFGAFVPQSVGTVGKDGTILALQHGQAP